MNDQTVVSTGSCSRKLSDASPFLLQTQYGLSMFIVFCTTVFDVYFLLHSGWIWEGFCLLFTGTKASHTRIRVSRNLNPEVRRFLRCWDGVKIPSHTITVFGFRLVYESSDPLPSSISGLFIHIGLWCMPSFSVPTTKMFFITDFLAQRLAISEVVVTFRVIFLKAN